MRLFTLPLLAALLLGASGARADTLSAETAGDVVMQALSLMGTPYRFGAADPEKGFDCSGLVNYVYENSIGMSLPRNSAAMYQLPGKDLSLSDLQIGDLIFFRINKSKRINHVALYIGEDRFVHAPSTGNVVRVDRLDSKYWMKFYVGARRVIPESFNVAFKADGTPDIQP